MNTLHTPGKWVCIDGKVFSDGFTTKTPIATVHKRKSPHVTLANARLISEAPELLQALQDLLVLYQRKRPGVWGESLDQVKAAKAAIQKATGGA
jgi:hypothetical protein